MRMLSLVVFSLLFIGLVSCSEGRFSTCLGGSNVDRRAALDDIDKYFMRNDFGRFIGRAVGELNEDFVVDYESVSGVSEPPTHLIGVVYSFARRYSVSVYFETKHTNPHSLNYQWDLSRINEEQISGIRVERAGVDDYYCNEFGNVWY